MLRITNVDFVIQQVGKTPGSPAWATVTIENTGDVAFTGFLGLSIQPSNYAGIGWIDAPLKNTGTLQPGQGITLTTNIATVPLDAAEGLMTGWVTLKVSDGLGNLVDIDSVQDPSAYTVTGVGGPEGRISSVSWM